MNAIRKTLLIFCLALIPASLAAAAPQLGGAVSPDGTPVMINVPARLRIQNVGGSDGAGLCVFSSINVSAYMQLQEELYSLQQKMRSQPGGGWPEKVDQILTKWAPAVDYAQYMGQNPEVLKKALLSGRSPGVTYNGMDPHYGHPISHMVNLVHLDDKWAAILDNNFIGDNELVWMSPKEFQERWCGKGSGWAVVLLKEPPDPLPQALGQVEARGGPPEQAVGVEYRWVIYARDNRGRDSRDRIWLETEELVVGCYYPSSGDFYFYDNIAKKWLSPAPPPFPPPVAGGKVGLVGTVTDYGLPLDMFPRRVEGEDQWTRKGQPTDAKTILDLLPQKKNEPSDPLSAAVPMGLALVALLSMYGAWKPRQ